MELESTRVFVKVVQQNSFSKAAELLKLPVSSVSRTISRLEHEVGTKLLHRTTRSLKLTSAGQTFFDASVGPVRLLEDARNSLHGKDDVVTGLVKITSTEDIGAFVVTPVISRLMKVHPSLSFEFDYTDEVVDLVKGGYDLAVRVGRISASRFKSRKLGEIAIIAVASPDYLGRKPKVREPGDLVSHDCITFTPGAVGFRWEFSSGFKKVTVPLKPKTTGNQMLSLISLATEGAGISFVPYFACRTQLSIGSLTRVLPGWSASGYSVTLVSPNTSTLPARVKLVADELAISIREVLSNS
jgi:LysR family transcriptional regulator, regulator for bpeEF and oprC